MSNFDDFPVGTRVKIKRGIVDFNGFSGEDSGIVARNSGQYLGIIVKFDRSRWIRCASGDTWEMKEFNFNPQHLEIIPDDNVDDDENTPLSEMDDELLRDLLYMHNIEGTEADEIILILAKRILARRECV